MALCEAVRETIWITSLLQEVDLTDFVSKPSIIFMDNQSAIEIMKNSVSTERNKHFVVKCKFVQEKIKLNQIGLCYVSSEKNLADIFLKTLSGVRTNQQRKQLGIIHL